MRIHYAQRITARTVLHNLKMQMVAGRYAGMTDIADMPTYAYIAPFPHMQFAQVCIQRGKAARVPDFDVPAVTAAIPGFNDFPAS